jgi:hypothetical protein
MLTAIRRASNEPSALLVLEIDVSECLPVGVPDAEAKIAERAGRALWMFQPWPTSDLGR